jgi:hypothetical protein
MNRFVVRVALALLCASTLTVASRSGQVALAAVTITRSELNSGQLRLEGQGAVPNHAILVDGTALGTSDGSGAFKIQVQPFSSATCQVTVSDGTSSAQATLSGCTPTAPTPTSTSAPAPSTPTATSPPTSLTVAFTPTSLDFGSQVNGTTSAAQTITATNTGTANLFFNNVAESGSFGLDYTIVNDGCIGLTLTPGQSCQTSVTFSPNNTGTMPESIVFTDNAANSPQTVPMTGTGTGTQTPLSIDDQFFACSGGVCDITNNDPRIVNNFYATSFTAQGGTPPYTWSSSQVPSGMTLHASGLLFGDPTALGTTTFQVTVTDAAGITQTGTFSLTTRTAPAPTPSGCQTGGKLTETLSGSAFNGQTPSGAASADETQFSGCGGFSLLSVRVSNVHVPDGTQLWVTLDFGAVGTITVRGGSGTMATYNMGDFGVSRDQIRVNSALPDVTSAQQILMGGGFH